MSDSKTLNIETFDYITALIKRENAVLEALYDAESLKMQIHYEKVRAKLADMNMLKTDKNYNNKLSELMKEKFDLSCEKCSLSSLGERTQKYREFLVFREQERKYLTESQE